MHNPIFQISSFGCFYFPIRHSILRFHVSFLTALHVLNRGISLEYVLYLFFWVIFLNYHKQKWNVTSPSVTCPLLYSILYCRYLIYSISEKIPTIHHFFVFSIQRFSHLLSIQNFSVRFFFSKQSVLFSLFLLCM